MLNKTTTKSLNRQQGAVSIFVVIFAALLMMVVTMSYTRLMIREQAQSNDNDLSQSAYDSALSGVEDAKRVLSACSGGNETACAAIQANQCSTVNASGVLGAIRSGSEVTVKSSDGSGSQLDQAYTCVKITPDTVDYLATLNDGVSIMIPLKAVGEVRTIGIEWYRQSGDSQGQPLTQPQNSGGRQLPSRDNWGANSPSLMRAQIINPGTSFNLSDLDAGASAQTGESVFIQPASINGSENAVANNPLTQQFSARVSDDSSGDNIERSGSEPVSTTCSRARYDNGQYACNVRLTLPRDSTISASSQTAFLRLSALYRASDVRITMYDRDNNPVSFDGVQPRVDSTGRANDIFRRVDARLQYGGDFAYPEAAIDTAGSLCKDFDVDDTTTIPGSCRPSGN